MGHRFAILMTHCDALRAPAPVNLGVKRRLLAEKRLTWSWMPPLLPACESSAMMNNLD